MGQVPDAVKVSAFVLVGIGTIGLLVSEFVFGWRRAVTLSFAAASAIGFVVLGLAHLWGRRRKRTLRTRAGER